MADRKIDTQGAKIPQHDGDANDYVDQGAKASEYFDKNRKVFFINGMNNTPEEHVEAALALSLVQMCTVRGIYNATDGAFRDFLQCIADKDQFDGPLSLSANHAVGIRTFFDGQLPEQAARHALSRNKCQLTAFDELRVAARRYDEIFAHSQGNLILSNVLQAIMAVDGPKGISGRVVHTFGSPTVNWPQGIVKVEQGFTFDPVTWLAGFDATWTISKVGMPSTSKNPITHAFREYLSRDPAFVVNRYRWGGLGVTFSLDTDGLAKCLAAMGGNFRRIKAIFDYIVDVHSYYSDDIALAYVNLIKTRPAILSVFKNERALKAAMIKALNTGWVTGDEKKAVAFLEAL